MARRSLEWTNLLASVCLLAALLALAAQAAGSDTVVQGAKPADGKRSTEAVNRIRYRPRHGNVGDAIPYYWKGQYHVFFLHEGRWAHIESTDLVHWRELPAALSPSAGSTSPDGEACWTGSIVEHEGVFHLFYTGKNSRDPAGDQKVMVATSRDLVHWARQPDRTFYADGHIYWSKPIGGPAAGVNYHHQAFRDPDVFWNQAKGQWWMLLHALAVEGPMPALGLYTSSDLVHWTASKPLACYGLGVSLDCPHAAPVQGRWLVIAADHHYVAANRPEGPYPKEMTPYDAGDLFVPKSLFDGKRRILWGWVRDLEGRRDDGQGLWGGTLSTPRELVCDRQGRLGTRPAAEATEAFDRLALDLSSQPRLNNARGNWAYRDAALECSRQGGACSLDAPADYLLEATVELDPSAELIVTMRQQDDLAGGYPFALRSKTQEVELKRGASAFARHVDLPGGAPIRLQAFVQDSILECFVNDREAFTCRAYDFRKGRLGLSVTGGGATVLKMTLKTLPRDETALDQ